MTPHGKYESLLLMLVIAVVIVAVAIISLQYGVQHAEEIRKEYQRIERLLQGEPK